MNTEALNKEKKSCLVSFKEHDKVTSPFNPDAGGALQRFYKDVSQRDS